MGISKSISSTIKQGIYYANAFDEVESSIIFNFPKEFKVKKEDRAENLVDCIKLVVAKNDKRSKKIEQAISYIEKGNTEKGLKILKSLIGKK